MLLDPKPELLLSHDSADSPALLRKFQINITAFSTKFSVAMRLCLFLDIDPMLAAAEWRLIPPSPPPNWSLCSLTQSWYNIAQRTAKPSQIKKWMGIAWSRLFGIQSTPKEGCRHLSWESWIRTQIIGTKGQLCCKYVTKALSILGIICKFSDWLQMKSICVTVLQLLLTLD